MAACFSVERTKYLMLSKSMPDRSAPQRGMGFFSNRPRALSRNSSIHCGLVLQAGDVGDDIGGEAPARRGARDVRVGPAEVVPAECRERLLLGERGAVRALLRSGRHADCLPVVPPRWAGVVVRDPTGPREWRIGATVPSGRSGASSGTCVVHAASPRAMVARRCTCVPSSSAKARVSASHSCGNSAATWAIGQWCWQSCTPRWRPLPTSRICAAYPRAASTPASAATRSCGAPAAATCAAAGPSRSSIRWAANPSTRLLPRVRGEVAQRGDGQVVVAVPEPGPACVGEQVVPGRAPPAAGAAARRVAHLGLPRLDQRVQVPADRGRRQLQLGRHRSGGARPLLHQQAGDGGAGATLGMARLGTGTGWRPRRGTRAPAYGGRVHEGNRTAAFHNTSVTYIAEIGKADPPYGGAG